MVPFPEQRPQLRTGWHLDPDDGTCLMEHVSQLAGLKFTDSPRCTDPLLAALAQLVNDAVSDEARPQLLGVAGRLASRPRAGTGSAPAIVLAALELVLDYRAERRDLRRHEARARRRATAAGDCSDSSGLWPRLLDELYRRGPARHALMCAVRVAAEVQPDSARDRLTSAMLDAALEAAGSWQASGAAGPDGHPGPRFDPVPSQPLPSTSLPAESWRGSSAR